MTFISDPQIVDHARLVTGIAAGFAPHGVYRSDGSPVLDANLTQGGKPVHGQADRTTLAAISDFKEGTFHYGGCVFGHFGHLLLETFARLSLFSDVSGDILFTSLNHTHDELFWRFVAEMDLPKERITVVDKPTIVERLVVHPPAFRIRAGIDLRFITAYEEIGDRIARKAGLTQNENKVPVFYSRAHLPPGRRYFFGETLVEDLLRDQGCDVVHPESQTVGQQIETALTRHRVLGFAGSALHMLVFSRASKRISFLLSEPLHTNFRLIESLKRNHLNEVEVELVLAPGGPLRDGPFLLSKAGIVQAASVLGTRLSESDVDPAAYDRCVENFERACTT